MTKPFESSHSCSFLFIGHVLEIAGEKYVTPRQQPTDKFGIEHVHALGRVTYSIIMWWWRRNGGGKGNGDRRVGKNEKGGGREAKSMDGQVKRNV